MATKNVNVRARYWTFILYPESAPEDWFNWLEGKGVSAVISPCHNKDVNKKTGELKKAHYHILLMFSGKKSYTQIKAVTDELNATRPETLIGDPNSMVQYFLHIGKPGKHLYPKSELRTIGTVDLDRLLKPTTVADKNKVLDEIFNYIVNKKVDNLMLLEGAFRKIGRADLLQGLRDNSAYVSRLLDGEYHLLKRADANKVSFTEMVNRIVYGKGSDDVNWFSNMFGDGSASSTQVDTDDSSLDGLFDGGKQDDN